MRKAIRLMMIYLVNMRKNLLLNLAFLVVIMMYFFFQNKDNPASLVMISFFLCSFFLPYSIVTRLVDYEEKNHTLLLLMTSPLSRKVVAASRFLLPLLINMILLLIHLGVIAFFKTRFELDCESTMIALGLIFVLTLIFSYSVFLLAEYMEIMTVMQVVRFLPFGIVFLSLGLKHMSQNFSNLMPWYVYFGVLTMILLLIMIWSWKKFLDRREWK